MRLLFVTDHVHLPQRVGGTKSSTHDLCLTLGERGHAVAVLCRLEGTGGLALFHRAARRFAGPSRPVADRVLGYPAYRCFTVDEGAVAAAAARFGAELVVVQAERPTPLVAAALATGRPVMVYLRDVELHKLDAPLSAAEPRLRYVANSAFTAARYREAFGLAAAVLPPLMRPERYRTCPDAGGRRFVTFCNPVPAKGSEVAFALAEARPDLPFLFVAGWPVGESEERARQQRARALGNVTWQPSVVDMRPVYARTRLLLAPSRWEEAWGRVASEAQMSGIPVLASRRGGLPEAVGPGGVLVDHDAPVEAWRSALSEILDDPVRYAALSAAASAHAARPEIQPRALVSRLEAIMAAHVVACADRSVLAGRAGAVAA